MKKFVVTLTFTLTSLLLAPLSHAHDFSFIHTTALTKGVPAIVYRREPTDGATLLVESLGGFAWCSFEENDTPIEGVVFPPWTPVEIKTERLNNVLNCENFDGDSIMRVVSDTPSFVP